MSTMEVMELNDPNAIKSRLDEIDKRIGALQQEKLKLGLRFSLALKQWAKDNPPVEPLRQMSQTSEMQHGSYITGFENRPHAGTGFDSAK